MAEQNSIVTGATITEKVARMLELAAEVRVSIADIETKLDTTANALPQLRGQINDVAANVERLGEKVAELENAIGDNISELTARAFARKRETVSAEGLRQIYYQNIAGTQLDVSGVADFYYFTKQNTDRRAEIERETTVRTEQFKGWLIAQGHNIHEIEIALQWPWGAEDADLSRRFEGDPEIVNMPYISTGNATDISGMFYGCRNLKTLPALDTTNVTIMRDFCGQCPLEVAPVLDTSQVIDAQAMFQRCLFTEVPLYNFSNCKDLERAFSYTNLVETPSFNVGKCENLIQFLGGCAKLKRVGGLNSGSCRNFDLMFYNSPEVERIDWLDFRSGESLSGMFTYCGSLRYLFITNLGAAHNCTSIDFRGASAWGDGSEENLQSLIDTLLTNSFDRAAASYSVCALHLDSSTADRLTDEQKAAITAKGYTIAS